MAGVQARAISRVKPNFAAIQAWNAASVYQQAIALIGQQIDSGGSTSARR